MRKLRARAGIRLLISLVIWGSALSIARPVSAAAVASEVALEVPSDGGGMIMYGRSWRVARFVWAGFMAGGGGISRSFDLTAAGQPTLNARTRTLVLPMVGPRVTFVFPIIAVSVGYAGFWGRTDLTVYDPGVGNLTGRTSGFGQGFYSPLLSLDFYSKKQDLVYGIGLGGFFGTSFPNLVASGQGKRITTDANPIDTITFHFKVGWDAGWWERRENRAKLDDL